MKRRLWVTFCSQTGTEIINISDRINLYPDILVTNHVENIPSENIETFVDEGVIVKDIGSAKPSLSDYKDLKLPDDCLITLHGYLRILPEWMCKNYEIYNGHPGLITEFPELKGKDPQERAYRNNYSTIGSVIHKVVPEVDSGEIIKEERLELNDNIYYTLNDYYKLLGQTSLSTWVEFLAEKFDIDEHTIRSARHRKNHVN